MSSFSRTFMRTSRCALRYQRGVNPVQQAWSGNQVRNYANAFTRDKPHVNIGMPFLRSPLKLRTVADPSNRYHWSRRPRKGRPPKPATHRRRANPTIDHPHSCHHQATGREGLRQVPRVRLHRQGPRRAQARYHHLHSTHRVLDRQQALCPRRLPRSRRLHQEHDHGSRQHGRRHHCRCRLGRTDAPDP